MSSKNKTTESEIKIPPVRIHYVHGGATIFGQSPWDAREEHLASFNYTAYPSCCGAQLLTGFNCNWSPVNFGKRDAWVNNKKPGPNHKEEIEIYTSMLTSGIKEIMKKYPAGCSSGTFAGSKYRGGTKKDFDEAKPYYEWLYEAFLRSGFKELCTFVNPVHQSKIWMIGHFSTKPEFATVGDTSGITEEKHAE